MKNKLLIIFYFFYLISFSFCEEFIFTVKENYSWTSLSGDEEFIEKNEKLETRNNYGIGFHYKNDPSLINIILYREDYDDSLIFDINYVSFDKNKKEISTNIKQYNWVPTYYYEQIKSTRDRYSILYKNEPFWYKWQNQFESPSTWQDDFFLGYYGFNDFYFFNRNSQFGTDEVCFLVSTEESSENYIKYKIYKIYNNFSVCNKQSSNPQEKFLPLYKKETPFYIFLTIDGDYMNMYIDEISEKNLFQTLIRTTPEACGQIEKWIKGESNDLSKVVMPKHGNNSATTTSQKSSTNVAPNKLMSVTENLKLRSGEVTTSSVLTVMQAGTKVKILELGKAENIDGIDSNWVKVEVQKSAKDRDGKEIKEGTVGWCYGGYLKETENTSSEKKKKK